MFVPAIARLSRRGIVRDEMYSEEINLSIGYFWRGVHPIFLRTTKVKGGDSKRIHTTLLGVRLQVFINISREPKYLTHNVVYVV